VRAYEPSTDNYARLLRNLAANDIKNVEPYNVALTGDGREITISGDPSSNTGGMSAFTNPNGHSQKVQSKTLTQIFDGLFEQSPNGRAKLLKIDCEGSEFEILGGADPKLLNRIEHLRGEFHINQRLKAAGCDPEALHDLCELYIPDVKIGICEISE